MAIRGFTQHSWNKATPPRLADEAALLDNHLAPAEGHDRIAGDGEAVIRAIVNRGVQGLRREGHGLVRVEEHEVRIIAWKELPLPRQPEDLGWIGATHFHPAVETEAASAHAEMMDQGQARFDTGDALAGLARLARLWAVIARDDVERAIGQSLPQRGLVMRLPDGRA